MAQAQTLEQQQLNKVLGAIKQRKHYQRNRMILLLTHWAGLRVGEVAALNYRDVIEDNGQMKPELVLTKHQTKGSKSRRVWLSERVRSELEQYIAIYPCLSRDQALFQSQKGNRFTPNSLTHAIKTMYEAAGFTHASSHSGRRSFITQLAGKGVSVRVLMALAGHQHIATTQRYIDVQPSMMREAVELI